MISMVIESNDVSKKRIDQYRKNLLYPNHKRDGSLTRKLFNDLAKANPDKKNIRFTL